MALKKAKVLARSRRTMMAWLVAMREAGIWEQAGIDFTWDWVSDPLEAERALMNGEIHWIFGNHITPYKKVADGKPVVCLAQTLQYSYDYLVSKEPMTGLRDLENRCVAMASLESKLGPHPRLNYEIYLKRAGVFRDRIDVLDVADSDKGNAILGAVHDGKAEAALVMMPHNALAQSMGLHVLPLPPLPMVMGATLTTYAPYVQKDPELFRRAIKAMAVGLHYFKTRPDDALSVIRRFVAPQLGIKTDAECQSLYSSLAANLPKVPYPTLGGIQNAWEAATFLYPDVKEMNPLQLWDMHFVRELDDTGFFRQLWSSPVSQP